jgi:hypothetical protein
MDKFLPSEYPLCPQSPIVYRVKEIMSRAWGFNKVIHHNPSPNPVSMDLNHLPILEKNLSEYVVTEKSDGTRYQLVLGINPITKRGFAVMVNRCMQMFEVLVYANSEYFKGSVFDGELVVEQQHTQVFLIFDMVMLKGESTRHQHLLERYNTYMKIFDLENEKELLMVDPYQWDTIAFKWAKRDKIVCLGNHMALQFRPKPLITLINIGSLWRKMNQHFLSHKSDGLIIYKCSAPIGTGMDESILKWKIIHTIDLIIEAKYYKGTWNYILHFQDDTQLTNNTLKQVSVHNQLYTLHVKPNDLLNMTSKYFGELHKTHYKLLGEFKCELDDTAHIIWCLLEKWRKDKQTPNNLLVIERTLKNLKDHIPIESLLNICQQNIYPLHTPM